jgi:hypothetical protein
LGDPLKGNLLLLYKPLHLEAQQVSIRIEVRRHHPHHLMVRDPYHHEWPAAVVHWNERALEQQPTH